MAMRRLGVFVILIAGLLVGRPTLAHAESLITGERVYGSNRYETAIGISNLGWPGTSDTIIITTGDDFPDALSAAPLAKKYNAPILLVNSKQLDGKVEAEIDRLQPRKAYIVGGTGAVSQGIQDRLTSKGITVTRLSGNNRYETSATVAREVGGTGKAVVATGRDFPDALSIASWAANNGVPILLTDKEQLPNETKKFINDYNITTTYVIGGNGVVSDSVMSALPNAKRVFGNDRFQTNLEVLKLFEGQFDYNKVYLATGNDFPDALSGAPLAAMTDSPLVLAGKGELTGTKAYMNNKTGIINKAFVLGGEGVISNSAVGGVAPPMFLGIDISMPTTVLSVNGKMKVTPKPIVTSSTAPKPTVNLSINNYGVASLDSDGTITGIAPGKVTVTASAGGKSVSRDITVREGKLIVLDPGHGGWSSGAVPKTSSGSQLISSREAVLNLQIAEKVERKLNDLGYNVIMTREGDSYISLEDRAKFSNDLNADMFISIHHDSLSKYSTGTSAFYSNYRPGIDTDGVYVKATGSGPVRGDDGSIIGYLQKGAQYSFIREDFGDIYIDFNGREGKTTIDYVSLNDITPSEVAEQSKQLADSINDGIASLGLPQRGAFDSNLAVTRWTNSVSVLVEVGFISNPYEFEKISQDSFQEQVADKIVQAVVDFYKN